jgi:methyl-accepting chemotaxis protein
MRIRRYAVATLIATAALVLIATSAFSIRQGEKLTHSMEEGQFKLMQSIIAFNIEGAETRALARAEMIAAMPAARVALAARDRETLLADFADVFAGQKERHGVDQMAFHIPPAQAFLRLQAPDQFGDDLTKFRPLVVAANRDKQSLRGLSVARSGPAIFGISPVKDQHGQHAGTVEVGLAFGALLDRLKEAYGLELAVFIDEEPLRQYATGVSSAAFDEQNRVGKYFKFHATNWALMRPLATSGDLTAMTQTPRFVRTAENVPYGVLLVELRNPSGKPIGVLAVAQDFSASRAAAGRSLVWQGAIALFGLVFFAGVVLVVLRGFVFRPLEALTRSFNALARGEREAPLPDSEAWCDELRELAKAHDTLRNAGNRIGSGR